MTYVFIFRCHNKPELIYLGSTGVSRLTSVAESADHLFTILYYEHRLITKHLQIVMQKRQW